MFNPYHLGEYSEIPTLFVCRKIDFSNLNTKFDKKITKNLLLLQTQLN